MRAYLIAMRTGLNTKTDYQRYYAEKLAGLIVDMAEQQTNILLQLFADNETIRRNIKYPERPLSLSNGRLQAYYHSHEENTLSESEHGHFHIFRMTSSAEKVKAVHLVGLSMDKYGQPRSWFTVNQWVTAAVCYNGQHFRNSIEQQIPVDNQENLIQEWLTTMLQFYQDKIVCLLESSQQYLESLARRNPAAESSIPDDKSIYFIDESSIDLGRDLAEFS
jgi:hypothetical protein